MIALSTYLFKIQHFPNIITILLILLIIFIIILILICYSYYIIQLLFIKL